ncbi:MAG: ATP-binding cassette domain-containing protein, partial [Verrucomicrobiales bacterium]
MREKPHIEFRNVTARYDRDIALDGLDFEVRKNTIFGIVGPANSGKTTMLKCINRTIDFIPSADVEGTVRVDGENVREIKNVYSLRRRIGMV